MGDEKDEAEYELAFEWDTRRAVWVVVDCTLFILLIEPVSRYVWSFLHYVVPTGSAGF
jgi:hypothetical protein